LPDQPDPVSCETLDDARRIAHLTSPTASGCLSAAPLPPPRRWAPQRPPRRWAPQRPPRRWAAQRPAPEQPSFVRVPWSSFVRLPPWRRSSAGAPARVGSGLPVISARWMLSRSWVTVLLTLRRFLRASVSVVSRSLRTSRVPLDYFPGNIRDRRSQANLPDSGASMSTHVANRVTPDHRTYVGVLPGEVDY